MLDPGEARGQPSSAYSLAFARLENHYFTNGGFLDGDGHILRHMARIGRIPGHIVQGRYDMICPPHTALALAETWPAARLTIVPDAGHSALEPGVRRALVAGVERFRRE